MTRGEVILEGLERIREGLDLIRRAGSQTEVLTILVGSTRGAEQLRQVMRPGLLRNVIVSMVHARNNRLSAETVEKVLNDFMDVLFDLSKPYEESKPQPPPTGAAKGA